MTKVTSHSIKLKRNSDSSQDTYQLNLPAQFYDLKIENDCSL